MAQHKALLEKCLISLDSLSHVSLSSDTMKATEHYEDRIQHPKIPRNQTIEFLRTIELVKAEVEFSPAEALLDLQDRLRLSFAAIPASRKGGAETKSIAQSIDRLNSWRRTLALYDNLDQARHMFSASIIVDPDGHIRDQDVCSWYLDSRYEYEEIPLPPPLKVVRTCWPTRRIRTSNHLHNRERAKEDVSRWQKGAIGPGEQIEARSAFLRLKYLWCHTFIEVSAMLRANSMAKSC